METVELQAVRWRPSLGLALSEQTHQSVVADVNETKNAAPPPPPPSTQPRAEAHRKFFYKQGAHDAHHQVSFCFFLFGANIY